MLTALVIVLNIIVMELAIYFQYKDVKTTKRILSLPGGYEKNKFVAWLQKKYPSRWGYIKIGLLSSFMIIPSFYIVDTLALLGASIPVLLIGMRATINNKRVITRLL